MTPLTLAIRPVCPVSPPSITTTCWVVIVLVSRDAENRHRCLSPPSVAASAATRPVEPPMDEQSIVVAAAEGGAKVAAAAVGSEAEGALPATPAAEMAAAKAAVSAATGCAGGGREAGLRERAARHSRSAFWI